MQPESPPLLVATRKGLFVLERGGDGWRIARHAFPGVAVSMTLWDSRDRTLYAGLADGHFGVKLHRSEDDGSSWAELPAPAFPENIPADDGKPAPAVSLLWSLEA